MTGIGRALRSMFWMGLLATFGWLAGLVIFVETLDAPRTPANARADGIIVLTGGADRIEDGIRLLEAGHARRLLISGVNAQVTMEQLRRTWPGHELAFDCCIDLDFRARNTIENARESAQWVRQNAFRSILLVTASYHMPRARLEFAEVLPGVVIEPYPVVPDRSRLEDWWREPVLLRLLAAEYTKFLAAWLRAAVSAS
ncbi:MAG: YdcF family protein [Beijerinckiaceae bacterium]|jgi:uncharacterized SAM-binding protein YcdF (DUF218 family)|nr:YdcF family protein [Beijerinckiaceae bacterium]